MARLAGRKFTRRSSTASWFRQKELEELFDSRDAAVHPETLTRPPVEDAGLGHHTAPEFVRFSAASATRAVDLLDEILDTCTTKPKPRLQGWADSTRPSYEQLLEAPPRLALQPLFEDARELLVHPLRDPHREIEEGPQHRRFFCWSWTQSSSIDRRRTWIPSSAWTTSSISSTSSSTGRAMQVRSGSTQGEGWQGLSAAPRSARPRYEITTLVNSPHAHHRLGNP